MTPSSGRLGCCVLAVIVIVGLSVSLAGCAGIGPVTPLPVSDIKSVSGTWEGTVYLPGSERDDVTLTIRDDGSYDVVSKTNLAVTSGKGHIVISDGCLVIEGERGRGAGRVVRNPAGHVLMKVEMTLSDNSNLWAELWRTR
jgi:hypothetical protein